MKNEKNAQHISYDKSEFQKKSLGKQSKIRETVSNDLQRRREMLRAACRTHRSPKLTATSLYSFLPARRNYTHKISG